MEGLDLRYANYCKLHKVLPNPAVSRSLSKAMNHKPCQRRSSLVVVLDHLKDADFLPMINVINAMSSSGVDAIDILNQSPCLLDEDRVLSLICAAGEKLHTLSLEDLPFTKHFLRDLFRSGLACQVLRLSSSSLQKLDMVGRFMLLRELNLDFCTSLTSLHKDCFSHMPRLLHLSMCGSRIADLWTTAAALSRLPSLTELRFQNCLCCQDTASCPAYSTNKSDIGVSKSVHQREKEEIKEFLPSNDSYESKNSGVQDAVKDQTDSGFGICSDHLRSLHLLDLSSDSMHLDVKNKAHRSRLSGKYVSTREDDLSGSLTDGTARKKYISHHASPICFERHYRDFMVSSLPRLEVLDILPIGRKERKLAKEVYAKYFEILPYKRQLPKSVSRVLLSREMGSSGRASRRSHSSFSRSLCAAKLGASPWPLLQPISNIGCETNEGSKTLRPRQFEYHPSDASRMAFGTLDGEVVAINHESGKSVAYMPSLGSGISILGLCWLKKYPSKVLAGSDNGLLRLLDIGNRSTKDAGSRYDCDFTTFDMFDQLTSVHINSMDEQFLVSGYTNNVALYDMATGKRLQLYANLHREPINVAKFAHHSPFMFATASFDRDVKMWDVRQSVRPCYSATSSRGNVMVCFSPDDNYLLVSAVDNEVKQLLAVDGRLHMDFGIASSGSSHNYTRSYYMSGNDYIISGSSDEPVVRVCCTQTGRRLRDIYFEGRGSDKSMFVQSLRSDPFRPFNMSILASYGQSNSKCDIIKVNMLSPSENVEEDAYVEQFRPSFSLGG